jgi:guanylate kinase
MKTVQRVVVVGKGGSGKDYITDALHEAGVSRNISVTTRSPRDGEIPGYTYDYIDDDVFDRLCVCNALSDHTKFSGVRYGVRRTEWESKQVFIMTPSGVCGMKADDRAHTIVVFLDITENVRRDRIATRSDYAAVDARIASDATTFEGFENFDMRITNPFFPKEVLVQLFMALAHPHSSFTIALKVSKSRIFSTSYNGG